MTTTKYTDGGISPRTEVYAERRMLKHAGPVMILDKFAQVKPMPKNKGQVIKFRRPKTFQASTVPLQEGVTPSAVQFSYEDVPANLKQYGMLVEVTDVIEDTHEDPVLNDASEQAGENIGRTTEKLLWGVLRAGTNVFYANGSQRTDVNYPIGLNKQRQVTRALKKQKAMKITKMLDGSTNFKTSPVEQCFPAVAHTDCESDVRNMAGFVPVAEYGKGGAMHETEIGVCEDVRYFLSPDLEPFLDGGGAKSSGAGVMLSNAGTSADVYPVLYFGKESYGTVPLRGQGAIEPTIIPVNKRDKSDPLGQRGYVGWKMWWCGVILNQLWMARLEVAVSDLN